MKNYDKEQKEAGTFGLCNGLKRNPYELARKLNGHILCQDCDQNAIRSCPKCHRWFCSNHIASIAIGKTCRFVCLTCKR